MSKKISICVIFPLMCERSHGNMLLTTGEQEMSNTAPIPSTQRTLRMADLRSRKHFTPQPLDDEPCALSEADRADHERDIERENWK